MTPTEIITEPKENTHIVIKYEDAYKYLETYQWNNLCDILEEISSGREKDLKTPDNKYYVCNTDEPYAEKVLHTILDGEKEKGVK